MSSAAAPPLPPPTIPLTTAQAPTVAPAPSSAPPISTTALRRIISRLTTAARRSVADARPWSELLDRSALSRPASFSDAVSRARRNANYFRANYALIVASALALSLLSHPVSLVLLLALLAAWLGLYLLRPADAPPLTVAGRRFSDREVLAGLVVGTVFVLFMTSVVSLLVSAALVGAAVVCLHGAFRVPEDLFMDEMESGGGGGGGGGGAAAGLFSFLGGAAGPAMAGRI